MKCKYTYKNKKIFNNEVELDDFLREKYGYESKFGDLIFSREAKYLRVKNIIENEIIPKSEKLQSKMADARRRATYHDGDETLHFERPYIGVNRFLSGLKYRGKYLHPEFRADEEYFPRRKENWKNPLKPGETLRDRFKDDEIDIFFEANPSKTYATKEEEFEDKVKNLRLLNDDECDQLQELMTNKWKFQAASGTAIHYVLQKYFEKDEKGTLNGDKTDIFDIIKSNIENDLQEQLGETKYKKYKDQLISDQIIEQVLDYAGDLKRALREKYGKTCEFYPELNISSTLAQENPDYPGVKHILGIIDLLVVDERGQCHIYDYKTSPKPYDKFDSAKKLSYQYQLGMYAKILKRYHIEYRDSDIGILPIQFDNLRLKNPEIAHSNPDKAIFEYSGIIPHKNLFELETRNKIFEVTPTGEEKILDILDEFVPEEIVYDMETENAIQTIREQNKTWYPDFTKFEAKSEEEIKELLEESGSFKPVEKEGKQMFIYHGKGIYSKEIIAESKEELVEKVKKHQDKREHQPERFAKIVKRALKHGIENNTEDISAFISSIDKNSSDPSAFTSWFKNKLGAYCNGNWELKEVKCVDQFGMIILKNINTNQIDIIKLSSSNLKYNPFATKVKDGKRITQKNHLLSYAHQLDIIESSNSKSLMLEGYKGNIELMEVLQIMNLVPELFAGNTGAVIGNVQIMNPFQGNGMSASNEELLYSFKKMSELSPLKVENNILNGKVKLGTTFDIAVNSINDAMLSSDYYKIDSNNFNSVKSELDKAIQHSDKEEKIKAIIKVREKLEAAHRDLANGKITREMLLTRPEARLYNELLQAERYLNGIIFKQQIKDHDKYIEEKSFKLFSKGLSGTYTDNPGNMLSDTLNTVAKLVTQAYQNIRNHMTSEVAKIRNATEELKKHKNYTGMSQMFGNATDMYVNMTTVINGDLLFTDLKSNKLDDVERKYLKLILEIINNNRFGGKKSKEELERMRDNYDIEYYRVPLCKATAESRDSSIGLKNGLLERLKSFNPKTALAEIRAKVDGVFMEEENEYENAEYLFTMNNSFDKSENNVEYRLNAIKKNGDGFFEKNLEMLAFKHTFAYSSTKELNKVFPVIKAAMTYLTFAGNTVNKTFVNDEKYFEDYIKSSIKGQPIQESEELKEFVSVTGKLKQIASFMALAFSPVQMTYQSMQGLWQDVTLVFKNLGVENTPFTAKNMWDAFKTIYRDLFHVSDKPSKCQLINEWLGVNDMDMNIYAERMRTDQHNKYNFVNFAFKFASRPDYYNRMTIIIAKMKADGIWDALEVKDNKLIYNFKKDKRFSAFANGNISDPQYNNQRALYNAIAQQFITEGTVDQDGNLFQLSKDINNPTPLPYAWTNQEGESIKSLCDLIYGYYSHEKKSLIHATFLGSLFMQMRTYWSGKKNQYLAPGGVRIQGDWKHAIDPNTKKPLYYQTKEDGTIDYDAQLTTEVTSSPFYQWEGKFQEGIIVTMSNLFNEGFFSKEGLKNGWNEIWNNEDPNINAIRRANIRQFGTDLLFYMIISGLIAGYLFADLDKDLKKQAKESGKVEDALSATFVSLFRKSLGQSTEDMAWWESIGSPTINWTPFALMQLQNTSKRAYNTLFGDQTFYEGITKSFAATKQVQPLVDFLNPKNF